MQCWTNIHIWHSMASIPAYIRHSEEISNPKVYDFTKLFWFYVMVNVLAKASLVLCSSAFPHNVDICSAGFSFASSCSSVWSSHTLLPCQKPIPIPSLHKPRTHGSKQHHLRTFNSFKWCLHFPILNSRGKMPERGCSGSTCSCYIWYPTPAENVKNRASSMAFIHSKINRDVFLRDIGLNWFGRYVLQFLGYIST